MCISRILVILFLGIGITGMSIFGRNAWAENAPQPKVYVRQFADREYVAAGEDMTITLQYWNPSAADAVRFRIENPIPAGTRYIDGSVSWPGVYDATANMIVWDIGGVPAGTTSLVQFQVRVLP